VSHEPLDDQRLRDAFAAAAEIAGDGSRCPTPERLWASAREELSGRENEAIVLHLGECAACATAWRLGRELASEDAQAPAVLRGGRWSLSVRWAPLLAAAVLVVAAGAALIRWLPLRGVEAPDYRGRQASWLQSQVPSGASLSRASFVLRWSEGPKGSTYEVHVTTELLDPLIHASGLRVAEYQVDASKLARVAAGERVLWRVIAHLPDGRSVASRTFVTTVE
jgi:hypothetical protein